MTIVKRLTKGSALTHTELDGNFTDLDSKNTARIAAEGALDARVVVLEVPKYNHGIEDYSSTSPTLALTNNVETKVLNDGAGAFTNLTLKIPGRGAIWNTTSSQFEFNTAGLVLGDTVTIRMDFTITTTVSNTGTNFQLNLAIGSGAPYSINIGRYAEKSAGTYTVVLYKEVYIGDLNTLNYPAELTTTAQGGGVSVLYNGHYVKYALQFASAT